ncbi:MAG: zinc ribbon domain-containing protein [Chloracidobacterium sp.]|nr:zinc ribbon domain-containing protein [Chloracidobacterium sp.]
MHCPSCGQQQISSETKFCSRCGMPLGIVAEVVANGGFLPQLAQLEQMNFKKPLFSKKNGVLFAVFWFIFLIFATAFFGILGAPEELVGITALTGVFGAMMIIIGSLVALPSSRPPFTYNNQLRQRPGELQQGAGQHGTLPAAQSIPVGIYAPPAAGSWRDTNDLQPASVTENTTRLLDEKEKL